MKVCGFSFIKNAVKFDYPIVEAVRSVLPLCDAFVIAVGDSQDGTLDLVKNIDPKIKIIETVWNNDLKEGGAVLADETNKAFQSIDESFDWCFYIQGDEAMHEQYIPVVRSAMQKYKDDQKVDGLLFKYKHFFGSYDYVGNSSKWYPNEIRVIKNNKKIYSYRDAQGFRKHNNEKLNVKVIDAYIYHYGWVREPGTMQSKINNFLEYWEGEEGVANANKIYNGEFDYSQIDSLEKFNGTHPAVMKERIARMNWKFERDLSYNRKTVKEKLKDLIFRVTGKRPFDYKNYKIV